MLLFPCIFVPQRQASRTLFDDDAFSFFWLENFFEFIGQCQAESVVDRSAEFPFDEFFRFQHVASIPQMGNFPTRGVQFFTTGAIFPKTRAWRLLQSATSLLKGHLKNPQLFTVFKRNSLTFCVEALAENTRA
jgi:hypothetical protein